MDQYGKLVEFITLVAEMVPELMNYKQRAQLILGLRARVSKCGRCLGYVYLWRKVSHTLSQETKTNKHGAKGHQLVLNIIQVFVFFR